MLRDGVYLLPEAQQSHEIFNEMSREISGEEERPLFLTQRGGKREPQKIPPFRIVEFFGGGPRHDDPPKATASI